MATFVLTDLAHDVWVEDFRIDEQSLGLSSPSRCSVRKRRLRGGRRDGVDLVEVQGGAISFAVIPTRGMGLWKGSYQDFRLGWDSPVTDGPVNPAFVNLSGLGGLGWLDGFDELLARCGLGWSGAPFEIKVRQADGSESNTTYGLHGKIANTPASFVAVHVADQPPHEITVEGHVEESHLFGPQVRMICKVSTIPGSNRLVVRDEFVNLRDRPVDMQVLYHWNFGPPFLEAGARFAAPLRAITPRDAHAAEGLAEHLRFRPPEPGFNEQVYFYELHAQSGRGSETLAMLRNSEGDKAVVLRFHKDQLPCFTLWKNTAGQREGYVTGLEPGTNYPNPKAFEKSRDRVVTLPVDGRYVVETTLEVLTSVAGVADLEREIESLQAQGQPTLNAQPSEPYARSRSQAEPAREGWAGWGLQRLLKFVQSVASRLYGGGGSSPEL